MSALCLCLGHRYRKKPATQNTWHEAGEGSAAEQSTASLGHGHGHAHPYDEQDDDSDDAADERKAVEKSAQEAEEAEIVEVDPLAKDPWMAICSRGDLNPSGPALVGCYDSKASSASLFRSSLAAWAINGPTNQGQPTFNWKEVEIHMHGNVSGSTDRGDAANAADARASSHLRHLGQPDVFNFEFELFAPHWDDPILEEGASIGR